MSLLTKRGLVNSAKKELENALKVLELPVLISLKELKSTYRNLAKLHHPDKTSQKIKMQKINEAYAFLKEYMESYKFTFSDEEVSKQFPQECHADKFRF